MSDQHILTKNVQQGISFEENNQSDKAIKIYEDIIKHPL